MLERVRTARSPHRLQQTQRQQTSLSLQRSHRFIERVYEAFCLKSASKQNTVKRLEGAFIKFEPYDCSNRPVFKELNHWPEISTQADILEIIEEKKRDKTPRDTPKIDKMTRRGGAAGGGGGSTARGYCEMCARAYTDAQAHRASPAHKAFLKDPSNFIALDSLISAGADVSAFLHKTQPVNGERRSLRKHMCNGDASNDSTQSNKDEKDKDYYKVVGVTTKLRSGASFQQQPTKDQNGLVVKFRKVRRSELSVLSDEAEQFMFPKKEDSSTEEDEEEKVMNGNGQLNVSETHLLSDRKRSARPIVFKEESSSEDSQDERPMANKPYQTRNHKSSGTMKEVSSEEDDMAHDTRTRRISQRCRQPSIRKEETMSPPPVISPAIEKTEEVACTTPIIPEIAMKEEIPVDSCLKWEQGRLKASEPVERMVFSFELQPSSEPWYNSYSRQDAEKSACRTVPPQDIFDFYLGCPRLPYQMPPLPPLRPGCCKLSELQRIAEPSKEYGTRFGKKKKIKRRNTQQPSVPTETSSAATSVKSNISSLPRKSPREHASTLAILGGMRNEDSRSLPSVPEEPETEQPPTVQRLLETVFDNAYEFDIPIESMHSEAFLTRKPQEFSQVITNYEQQELLITSTIKRRKKGRCKKRKKNLTGWPKRKKSKMSDDEDETSQTSQDTSELNGIDSESIGSEVSKDKSEAWKEKCDFPEEKSDLVLEKSDLVPEKSDSVGEKSNLVREKSDLSQENSAVIKKSPCTRKLLLLPVVRVTKIDVDRKLRSSDGLKGKKRR